MSIVGVHSRRAEVKRVARESARDNRVKSGKVGLDALEKVARWYEEQGNTRQAAVFFSRAAQLRERNDPVEAIRLWHHAGLCSHNTHDARAASAHLERAVALVPPETSDRPRLLAHLLTTLCHTYYVQSRFSLARRVGEQALEAARCADEAPLRAAALLNLGLVLRYQGEAAQAITRFDEARAEYLRTGRQSHGEAATRLFQRAANALYNTGRVHLDQRALDKGEQALRTARSEKMLLKSSHTRVDVELCRLRFYRGGASEALTALRRILESPGLLRGPVVHLQALAVQVEVASQVASVMTVASGETAVTLALSMGTPPGLCDILGHLVRTRVQLGQEVPPRERTLLKKLVCPCCEQQGKDISRVAILGCGLCSKSPSDNALRLALWGNDRVHAVVRSSADKPGEYKTEGPAGFSRQALAAAGDEVRRLRRSLGLTRESLSERTGYALSTIKRVEKGVVPERTIRVVSAMLRSDLGDCTAKS